jgi:hypothetical protein
MTAADLRQRLAKIKVRNPAVGASTVKPGRWSSRKPGTEHSVGPHICFPATQRAAERDHARGRGDGEVVWSAIIRAAGTSVSHACKRRPTLA